MKSLSELSAFSYFVCAVGRFINSIKDKCFGQVSEKGVPHFYSHSKRSPFISYTPRPILRSGVGAIITVGLTKSLVSESEGLDSDGDFSFSLCSP